MPLGIHLPEVGVGELVERIVFELFVEGLDCLVVLAVVPVNPAEIVVGVLVVGIYYELLLEGGDGLIVLAQREVDEAQVVPRVLVLGIDFGGALEKYESDIQVAVVGGGAAAIDQVVGLHVGRRNRGSGYRALNRQLLGEVGAHGATE